MEQEGEAVSGLLEKDKDVPRMERSSGGRNLSFIATKMGQRRVL